MHVWSLVTGGLVEENIVLVRTSSLVSKSPLIKRVPHLFAPSVKVLTCYNASNDVQ